MSYPETTAPSPGRRFDGLLIDYGGVLTSSLWASFDAFCREEGLPEGAIRRQFRDEPDALALLREFERGEIADTEFERRFAERLGVDSEGLIQRLFAGLTPNEEMVAAVKLAGEAGLRTGLISNSWGTGIYDRAPLDAFHEVVISGDEGLHKPEPEIYHLGARRIGVDPERCVFVDDLRENIKGAENVGMTAVLHRDTRATLARLEELLGIRLSDPR
ncbi:MAG: HAD family hydrolase [Solirubrobacterales bacterium]